MFHISSITSNGTNQGFWQRSAGLLYLTPYSCTARLPEKWSEASSQYCIGFQLQLVDHC